MSYLKKFLSGGMILSLVGFFLSSGIGYAQTAITGTVTDQFGEPLIGASVTVEGNTSVGAITDLDGNYELSVPAGTEALRFSYIGMKDLVEQINGRTVINVSLSDDNIALNATVVTAMGITKSEKSLSYNVQQMELESVSPTGSFVNSINGKVAGVSISTSSTGAGGASRVVMRGSKSLSNNNNALYVIDGIPMAQISAEQPEGVFAGAGQTGDALSAINPEDIESISVLSGPSASALYGAAAANGVVVITTKKGQQEKLSVNYSNTTEFSRAYYMPEFQNTYGPTEERSYQSWGAKMDTPSSYSPRNFFQTGLSEVNSISLSSGTEKNQIYVSMSAANSEGIIRNNNVDKYNFSLRNTTKLINDKLTADVQLNYSNIREQNMVAQGQYMNPVLPVYLFPAGGDWASVQVFERYNADRNFKTQFWPYGNDFAMQNPYWITDREWYNNTKNRVMGTVQLKYEFTKWLNLSVRGKFDRNEEKHDRRLSASTLKLFASDFGYYGRNEIATNQKFAEAILNVNKYFGDNIINLVATIGANIDYIDYESSTTEGNLKSVANLFTFDNIDRTHTSAHLTQNGYKKENQAAFINTQIGYRSKAYLDLTGRLDWASTFANSGNNPFFYYSAGLSGILTELIPGLKSSAFPYWKIRGGYSEVGNSPATFLTIPTYVIKDGNVTTRTRMEWTDLKPERTKSWELGTNIHFLDSKLQADITLYKSKTFNQFFEFTLPSSSRYSSVIANAGDVSNKGIEVAVRYGDDFGDFHWDTYATYSRNVNRVDQMVHDFDFGELGKYSTTKLEPAGMGGVKTVIYEGGSMGDLYVTSLKTDEKGYALQNSNGNVIADLSDDGYIYAGSTDAKHRISWGNNFSWKGINLSFLFNARLGGIVVSKTQAVMDYYGISQVTADARDRGYVLINDMQYPNVKDYYQVLGGGDGVLSNYVYSATNVRLAELTLGYDIPVKKWCSWLQGLNVSFVGHNLWMLYCKAPFDPEMTSNTGTYYQGIDYFMQPSTRNLGFSVKVRF